MKAWKEQQRSRLKLAYANLHENGIFSQNLGQRAPVASLATNHKMQSPNDDQHVQHDVLLPTQAAPSSIPVASRVSSSFSYEAFQHEDELDSPTDYYPLWDAGTGAARHVHAPSEPPLQAHSDRLTKYALKAPRDRSVNALAMQRQARSPMLARRGMSFGSDRVGSRVSNGDTGSVSSLGTSTSSTSSNRLCCIEGCLNGVVDSVTRLCKRHGGGHRCRAPGCQSCAANSISLLCKRHGGGKRCKYEGCTKSAAGQGLCKKHGGGRRCTFPNCTKSAASTSDLCSRHGGGPRCMHPNCKHGAVGTTSFCVAHGGGRRCSFNGCTNGAQTSMEFCKRHMKEGYCGHDPMPDDTGKVDKLTLHEHFDMSDECPKDRPKLFEAPTETGPAIGSFEHFIAYQRQRGRVESAVSTSLGMQL